MITPERIESMMASVQREGWDFLPAPPNVALASHSPIYEVRRGALPAFWLAFSPAWVSAQTSLPPKAIPGEGHGPQYRRLLAATDDLHLAKYSLTRDGVVWLSAELPSEQFSVFQLKDLLQAIVRYRSLQAVPCQDSGPSRPSPMLPDPQVEAFFAQIAKEGWKLGERRGEDGWPARYCGRFRDYTVYFTWTTAWAYFQAVILCWQDSQPHNLALATYLLELNDRIHWAKFSLRGAVGRDGEPVDAVLLTVEAPTSGFRCRLFCEAARTLATYLERYFFEINLLGQEPGLAPLVLGGEPDPEWFREPLPTRPVSFSLSGVIP